MSEETTSQPKKNWWHDGMIFFIKVSGWIAGPVLIVLAINFILERYTSVPSVLFVFMMLFGFMFSIFGLVKESKRYMANALSEKDSVDTSKNNDIS